MRLRLLIAMIALLPAPALAADERRLSAAEVEQILDKAAQKREAPTIAQPVEKVKPPARPIEGEVGVSVGSGGTREVFGTAIVPVGEDGVAIVTIDNAESNRGHRRRR